MKTAVLQCGFEVSFIDVLLGNIYDSYISYFLKVSPIIYHSDAFVIWQCEALNVRLISGRRY